MNAEFQRIARRDKKAFFSDQCKGIEGNNRMGKTIDLFYIGDTGLGIGKLITCGGLGIWTIIDWFMIMGTTREKNLMRLMSII